MDKKRIYQSFLDGALEVMSVSVDRKVEWKRITDVTRHDVYDKEQYRVVLDNSATCSATGDHSLFTSGGSFIKEYKTGDFLVGDTIICVEDEKVIERKVAGTIALLSMQYMYDLSVEDNQNFVLKNGILAHNTFRPPSSEKFIQAQAQVFSYIWEDEELYEYLLMAIDDLNSAPPVTDVNLDNIPNRWRTAVNIRAAAFACMAVSLTWIANEFDYSISGVSLSIDKSSKYQSMKQNFEQEYDKAKDGIKRSIKIIKGLRQPRYGVGISSALGPYSRPGVQSRRNFVSGFRGGWS